MSIDQLRCGDILGFITRQAPNHYRRYKYHLYLGVAHDDPGKHVLMFISSGGTDYCMRIDKNDWPEMQKAISHINCQELYEYTQRDLSRARPKGRLNDKALQRLLDHAAESETLASADIDVVVDALIGYFKLLD